MYIFRAYPTREYGFCRIFNVYVVRCYSPSVLFHLLIRLYLTSLSKVEHSPDKKSREKYCSHYQIELFVRVLTQDLDITFINTVVKSLSTSVSQLIKNHKLEAALQTLHYVHKSNCPATRSCLLVIPSLSLPLLCP